jgi:hypothetical protein
MTVTCTEVIFLTEKIPVTTTDGRRFDVVALRCLSDDHGESYYPCDLNGRTMSSSPCVVDMRLQQVLSNDLDECVIGSIEEIRAIVRDAVVAALEPLSKKMT